MKPNILMVGAAETGGVANYIKTLAPYLDPFYSVYMTNANHFNRFTKQNMPIEQISFDVMYSSMTLNRQRKSLEKILQKYRIDLLHLHTLRAGFLGSLANIGLSIPIIYTAHGWRFEQKKTPLERYLFLQFDKFVCRKANMITCIRRRDFSIALWKKLAPGQKLIIIPTQIEFQPPVDNRAKNSIKAEWGIPEKRVVIGNVASLTNRKDPFTFFRAAEIIRNKYPNTYFVWVGNGDLRDKIENWSDSHGLKDSYRITGMVSHEEIFRLLGTFDIFLLTSKIEAVPLSVLEAQAVGRTVISSEFLGIEEVVEDGITGYTFPVGNYVKAAECVAKVLNNKEEAQRISEAGKKVFDEVRGNPGQMAEMYLHVYQRAYDQIAQN